MLAIAVEQGPSVIPSTPVEPHRLAGRDVLVKREDLCSPYPGPQFSKHRGVEAHLRKRPETVIGVLDTAHSKAGWSVATVCRDLGKRCLNFYPVYKADGPEIRPQQVAAGTAGAELFALPAGRSAILYHRAKAMLPPRGYMMPNALKLPESVEETACEVVRTEFYGVDHVVISASSGTIASGVCRGLSRRDGSRPKVWVHLGYSRPLPAVMKYLESNADLSGLDVAIVDEGYAYADAVSTPVPFPCNPYYDAKAWRWLGRSVDRLDGRILFWNVGA